MTASPTYHPSVDHPPRFLEHGLPPEGVLTADDLRAFPEDPFWEYELLHGVLAVRSDGHRLTFRDLEAFPRFPNWKYELLEGTLIVSPNAPDSWHQDCAGSLYVLLRQTCPADLKAIIAPFEYVSARTGSMLPDILIAHRPVPRQRLTQAPVLVVEVLSPSTRQFDLKQKRAFYQQERIEHYWIVDPAGPSIEALRLVDGEYVIATKADAGQVFEVSEPVPVSFDPAVLLDE
jgi:Uma2 family endonuclease